MSIGTCLLCLIHLSALSRPKILDTCTIVVYYVHDFCTIYTILVLCTIIVYYVHNSCTAHSTEHLESAVLKTQADEPQLVITLMMFAVLTPQLFSRQESHMPQPAPV